MTEKEKIVFDAIYERRSVRYFDDAREVEREKITKLLKAAMAAPSACNIQPWDFIVIDDKALIGRIKGDIERYGDYNVPVIIVVTGNNEHIPWKDHGIIDCALAMENVMIAAPTLGLGTVCVGGFNREKVKTALSIPESCEAIGMIYLGYPKEEKGPRTRYREDAVHWNGYDNTRSHEPRPGNIIVFGPESSI